MTYEISSKDSYINFNNKFNQQYRNDFKYNNDFSNTELLNSSINKNNKSINNKFARTTPQFYSEQKTNRIYNKNNTSYEQILSIMKYILYLYFIFLVIYLQPIKF